MIMRPLKKLLWIFWAITMFTAPQSAWAKGGSLALKAPSASPSEWETANALYGERNYSRSAQAYASLLTQFPQDPSLHFNLGNALFRQGELGKALYHYEEALVLDPRSPDIRGNRDLTRTQLRLADLDKRPAWVQWCTDKISYVRRGELFSLTLLLYLALLGSSILRFYDPNGWVIFGRRFIFWTLFLVLPVLAFKVYETWEPEGIVLVSKVEAKYGPASQEKTAFSLAEGMKVKVAEKRSGWYRIQLPSGDTGWVTGSSLGILSN